VRSFPFKKIFRPNLLSLIIVLYTILFLSQYSFSNDYYDCVSKIVYEDCHSEKLYPRTNCTSLPNKKISCSEKIDLNETAIREAIVSEVENNPGTVYAAHPFLVCSDSLQLKRRGDIFKWKLQPITCKQQNFESNIQEKSTLKWLHENYVAPIIVVIVAFFLVLIDKKFSRRVP